MLATLRSISRVFGKQDEYENFVSYMKWGADATHTPSTQDIFSHTPEWVKLVLPILGVLYDTAYCHGIDDTDAEWSRNYSQNKST